MSFANRGKCLNGECRSGCTIFIALDGPPVAQLGLAKCAVCVLGCYAAQHLDMNGAEAPPTAPPAPVPPVAPSATFSSIFGSRRDAAATAGPEAPKGGNPFNIHIKARQESINSKLKDPANTILGNPFSSGQKFHPAEKSQLDGDLNPHNSKGKARKRKRKKNTDTEGSEKERAAPKPRTSAPKSTRSTKYSVVLVEGTKDVALQKYLKPNVAKLLQLSEKGYVRNVDLGDNCSADQVKAAVEAVFTHVGELSAYGFRLLRVSWTWIHGSGVFILSGPVHPRLIFYLIRARAMATIKDAGTGFKNTVFISINPAGPNLVFRGSDISAEYPTVDISSDEDSSTDSQSDASDEISDDVDAKKTDGVKNENQDRKSLDPAKETESTRTGEHNDSTPNAGETKMTSIGEEKRPNPPEKRRMHRLLTVTKWFDIDDLYSDDENLSGQESGQHQPDPADEKQDPAPESGRLDISDWTPYPASYQDFLCLLKNMSKPENAKDKKWWRETPLEHFQDFNVIIPLLADIIDSAECGHLAVDDFFTKVHKYIPVPKIFKPSSSLVFLAHNLFNALVPLPQQLVHLIPTLRFMFACGDQSVMKTQILDHTSLMEGQTLLQKSMITLFER
ncbi:hypothetical protein C8J57DRAFT_1645524 [Mycena rebaudengoi]|nr:hypothetical protein C8J57DRAFT_1645524 [Mycena rebaudengoi]